MAVVREERKVWRVLQNKRKEKRKISAKYGRSKQHNLRDERKLKCPDDNIVQLYLNAYKINKNTSNI